MRMSVHLMVHLMLVIQKMNGPNGESFIPHSQTKAFCLAQGDKWFLSSAKRLNEQEIGKTRSCFM